MLFFNGLPHPGHRLDGVTRVHAGRIDHMFIPGTPRQTFRSRQAALTLPQLLVHVLERASRNPSRPSLLERSVVPFGAVRERIGGVVEGREVEERRNILVRRGYPGMARVVNGAENTFLDFLVLLNGIFP